MGNSRKGKRPKKQYHAAYHSGMGSKRKLSRMGKKRKSDRAGLDATFISRAQCLKRLQVTLRDFRRLCILKGIYPREPRGRAPGNRKGQVYYHAKDVRAIAHEPILEKFREFKAFMKKVRRAAGRNEKDLASRMDAYAPHYTLHHLVRERYPRFVDALSDLDDALALAYLFAALPSEGRVRARVTNKAKSLAASWGAYCAVSSSITRTFVSVKGVYLEAEIKGTTVRWVVPHAFAQNLPKGVDFRVMLTFFEFYETLLGFVLFKLYGDLGVRYPLAVARDEVAGASTPLAAHLRALTRELKGARGSVGAAVAEAVGEKKRGKTEGDKSAGADEAQVEAGEGGKKLTKKEAKKKRALLKSVDAALSKVAGDGSSDVDDDDDGSDDDEEGGVAAPLKAALETVALEGDNPSASSGGDGGVELDEGAARRRRLFAGLTFFLSREVPRGYVELVILSRGGKVGWEGEDSPVSAKDPSVTHHVVDRPKLPASFGSLPKSREFVQPQWVLDSANNSFLLPCGRYGVGKELPPHLSPWVDHDEEGYKPKYAEEIERIKNGEALEEEAGSGDEDKEGRGGDDAGAGGGDVKEDVEQTPQADESGSDKDNSDEEDEGEAEEKARKRRRDEDEEARALAKGMMSNKASRLYGRMQHGIEKKKERAEELRRRREEIEEGRKKKGKKRRKAAGAE